MATVEEVKQARDEARQASGKTGERQQAPEGTTLGEIGDATVSLAKSAYEKFTSGPKFASTGILDTIGIPGSMGELQKNITGMEIPIPGPTQAALSLTGQDAPSFSDLPSGYELRGAANEAVQTATGDEDTEMVLPPGEEPETFYGRTMQNLGSMLVPMAATAKGAHSGGRLATEIGSEVAGAGLGLALEKTDTFKDNPMLGRLTGELVGGMGVPFTASGGFTKPLVKGGKAAGRKVKAGFSDEYADKVRAAQQAQDVTVDPDMALKRMKEGDEVSGELSEQLPAFTTNDQGAQNLTISATKVDPDFAQEFAQRASKEASDLQKAALKSGDPEDATKAINRRMEEVAGKATSSSAKFRQAGKIPEISEEVTSKLKTAYKQARDMEKRVWAEVPDNPYASPSNTRSAVKQLWKEHTTKSARRLVPNEIKEEFGDLKNGELVGGEFSKKTPKAKELHQIYSALGNKLAKAQSGEVTPAEVRNIRNVREAILDDLKNAKGGEKYQEAIDFSADLNNKFTKNEIGEVMGFQQGDAMESNVLLQKLADKQGPEQANAVERLLEASPEADENVRDFLRSSFFARNSKELESGDVRIKPDQAREWLRKHDDVLQKFPDLRNKMSEAIENQGQLDSLYKNSTISGLSPYNKEKAVTAQFLGEDPVAAMTKVISEPGQRQQKLSQLVGVMRKEGNEGALGGLQSSFMESLFESSRRDDLTDQFTNKGFISGTQLRSKLDKMKGDVLESGLFSKGEFSRMQAIANRLEGVEKTMMQRGLQGGLIEPKTPKKVLDMLFRTTAARAGGEAAGGSMGGSLQTANIAVEEARNLLKKLTQDESEALLVKAARDPETFKQLLENPLTAVKGGKESTISKLVREAKKFSNRPGTLGPAATTGAKAAEEESKVQRVKRLRNQLREQGPMVGAEQ